MDATKSVSASSQDTVNILGMGDEGFYGISPIGLEIETEFRYEAQNPQRRTGGGEHRKAEPDPFESAELVVMSPDGVQVWQTVARCFERLLGNDGGKRQTTLP